MAMVNGKIVGTKAKKIKKALKLDKPKEEAEPKKKAKVSKKEKNPIKEDKTTKTKKTKKTRKETSEPEIFRIQIGPNTFLSVDLDESDKGEQIVAVRKWYNTQKDPEIKQARGGFNMQPKSSELKLLATRLRDIARVIDESKD